MTITISRLYDNYADAERAVTRLESAGVPHSDISIVANNSDNWYGSSRGKVDRDRDGVDDRAEGAGTGAGIGAGVGGAAGLLAGLGLLAIPGLGPVVAAGWLASTAVGAAAGAATGGIVGALTEAGVSKEDASRYAEGVRRGGTLVSARVPDQDRARLDALLHEKSVNLQDRSAAWQKTGWTDFDAASPPLSPEDIGRERELYGVGGRR
ncbi:general stress protein [Bradyrhizobium guangxiense]|uniref:general stress protein n=1 Tax=Bradyrhizobium guangxiense TaxID=1325115 RepID=UPI0010092888|nr:general stress protein [Bradyrhizobium guangxiense]